MSIVQIFPTNILIKDNLPFTQQELSELEIAAKSIWTSFYQDEIGSHTYSVNSDPMPVFTQENLKIFPSLKKLKDCFADAFLELAESFDGNTLNKQQVDRMIAGQHGQMPIMKHGDSIALHTHPGSLAYGIFYLEDVDNDKQGGTLQLWDPSFHINAGFRNPQIYEVDTKACRMVICPTYIWHQVTQYFGQERISIVCNLAVSDSVEEIMMAGQGGYDPAQV